MPPVCAYCKEIGHSIKHYRKAPITCRLCSSTAHGPDHCPRDVASGPNKTRNTARRRSKTPTNQPQELKSLTKGKETKGKEWAVKVNQTIPAKVMSSTPLLVQSAGIKLGSSSVVLTGESSGKQVVVVHTGHSSSSESEPDEDSSDVESTGSETKIF